ISNNWWWIAWALGRSLRQIASHISTRMSGRRLPTAFISPHPPTTIMGSDNSSRPTKILNSLPRAATHSETKPKSLTACFIPTKVADLARSSLSVSMVTPTAVRPGMLVHHPRQVADLRELEKVSDQTALRRAAVVGGNNKERGGSGTGGVLGESSRLRQRLRAGCRDYGDALGSGVDRYIH